MDYSHGRHLAVVELRIAELRGHIDRQRQVLSELDAAKLGKTETAEFARQLLRTLERNLQCQIRDKKRVSALVRK